MKMERETGFEPATSTLARSHSTAELLPLRRFGHYIEGGAEGQCYRGTVGLGDFGYSGFRLEGLGPLDHAGGGARATLACAYTFVSWATLIGYDCWRCLVFAWEL